MNFPRVQLFEFNDVAWAPAIVRDTIVESLSRTLAWGRTLRGLVAPFEAFVAMARAAEILDLAAGAGGPARILAGEILRAGRVPPRFVLTDLYPRHGAWEEARAELPGIIDFVPDPVDATRIPAAIAAGRARVMINAFHHLPPAAARGVLDDAVRARAPIFIAEVFERTPLGFVPMAIPGAVALAAAPLYGPRDRLAKALLVWSTPLMYAIGAWDGVTSTLRIYDRADLDAMVAPLGGGFAWTHGTFPFPFGGKGTFFYGVPARAEGRADAASA